MPYPPKRFIGPNSIDSYFGTLNGQLLDTTAKLTSQAEIYKRFRAPHCIYPQILLKCPGWPDRAGGQASRAL